MIYHLLNANSILVYTRSADQQGPCRYRRDALPWAAPCLFKLRSIQEQMVGYGKLVKVLSITEPLLRAPKSPQIETAYLEMIHVRYFHQLCQ